MSSGIDLPKKNPELSLGKNYLLVIGINKYKDTKLPRLNNAVLDAKEIKNLLLEKYQFEHDKLMELYDEDASQSQIINALRTHVKLLGKKDSLLIYFAGHGEYDEDIDVGYWIPNDAEYANIGSYLSFDMLTRWLKAIKSRHTFVLTDSCHSGSFFTTNRNARSYEDRMESLASRWLLTAGRNEPVPDGAPGEHSPFAQAVLYHLDENDKPRFPVSDFCKRIERAVGNNSDALPRSGALRNVGDMGGEFMFRLKPYADKVFEEELPTSTQSREEVQRNIRDAPVVAPPPKKEEVEPPMRTIEDVRNRIKKLLRKDEFKAVFELMNEVVDDRSRRQDEIIMQESQYNSISRQMRSHMVDPSFAQITLNKIRYAINAITDDLKEKDLKADALEHQASENQSNLDAIDALEKEGLIEQAETLQKKLNYLQKELLTAYDANQKFALQEQIDQMRKTLKSVKAKLS